MLNEKNLDLRKLIRSYTNNTCSKEELQLILDLAKDPSEAFSEALKNIWEEGKLEEGTHQISWDDHFNFMMSNLKSGPDASQAKEIQVREMGKGKRRFLAIGIAAAFLGLICLTAILVIRSEQDQIAETPTNINNVIDIQPGRDRAILTLGDGKQILLDSAINGTLASQGGIRVVKVGGSVMYSEEGNSTQVFYNTISTPNGGQYQLILADGTKVWLNAASSITYPTAFLNNERKVSVIGEAYFEVSHDPTKPFTVSVNRMEVEVLGTRFNINAYADEDLLKTTLLEGRVKVKKPGNSVILNPAQQALISNNNFNATGFIIKHNIDVEAVIAWKNGLFNFDHSDISKILREFSRWYDIEIQYEGKITEEKFFGIVSRNSTLSSVLKALKAGGPDGLNYKIEGKKLIVQSANKD